MANNQAPADRLAGELAKFFELAPADEPVTVIRHRASCDKAAINCTCDFDQRARQVADMLQVNVRRD